ncbi:MAG: hypothetical protein R3C53_14955 [Pirellulaceae bacterium]
MTFRDIRFKAPNDSPTAESSHYRKRQPSVAVRQKRSPMQKAARSTGRNAASIPKDYSAFDNASIRPANTACPLMDASGIVVGAVRYEQADNDVATNRPWLVHHAPANAASIAIDFSKARGHSTWMRLGNPDTALCNGSHATAKCCVSLPAIAGLSYASVT